MKKYKKGLWAAVAATALASVFAFGGCTGTDTAHEHDWNDWSVTTPATCTTAGEKVRTCKTDSTHKETEVIPATGHSYATGDNWTVDVAPTCQTKGSKSHHCTHDGCSEKADVTEMPVDPEAHDYATGDDWTVDVEPTATTEGSKSHHCKHAGCTAKKDDTVIEKVAPAAPVDGRYDFVSAVVSVNGEETDITDEMIGCYALVENGKFIIVNPNGSRQEHEILSDENGYYYDNGSATPTYLVTEGDLLKMVMSAEYGGTKLLQVAIFKKNDNFDEKEPAAPVAGRYDFVSAVVSVDGEKTDITNEMIGAYVIVESGKFTIVNPNGSRQEHDILSDENGYYYDNGSPTPTYLITEGDLLKMVMSAEYGGTKLLQVAIFKKA